MQRATSPLAPRRVLPSSHISRMAERVPARLRPHTQTVRLATHRDASHEVSVTRVEHVHLVIIPPGDPQLLSIGGHIAHVRTAPVRDAPGVENLLRVRIHHGDGAGSVAPTTNRIPSAIA